MSGFDIRSILDFRPPKYICASCRGLFRMFDHPAPAEDPWGGIPTCPVCQCSYVRGQYADERLTAVKYLGENGLVVEHGQGLIQHATNLATLVQSAQGNKYRHPWPTMRLLFETLSQAKYFVHFASWGVSHLLIGALKVTSMRVPVYGFVSNVEEHARAELTEFPNEAPRMHAHTISSRAGAWDAPHQKLVVVDGLLAFKGSTNLTNNAIRKADRGLDVSEVVTDFEQVTQLNNKFFAPVWKNITDPNRVEFAMYDDAPF